MPPKRLPTHHSLPKKQKTNPFPPTGYFTGWVGHRVLMYFSVGVPDSIRVTVL